MQSSHRTRGEARGGRGGGGRGGGVGGGRPVFTADTLFG